MNTATEFVAKESVRAVEELEQCLTDMRTNYETDLQTTKDLEAQAPKDYEARLRAIFDQFIPKITPPSPQAKSLVPGLSDLVLKAIDSGISNLPNRKQLEQDAFNKYCKDVQTAFDSCFTVVSTRFLERIQQYESSASHNVMPADEKAAEALIRSRSKDYKKATSRQRRGIADQVDTAIISSYEAAEKTIAKYQQQKKSDAVLKMQPFVLPLRLNLIENQDKNLVEISMPVLRKQHAIFDKIDGIVEKACNALCPQYQNIPGNYSQYRINEMPMDKVQKSLEDKFANEQLFKDLNLQFKYFKTNIKEPPVQEETPKQTTKESPPKESDKKPAPKVPADLVPRDEAIQLLLYKSEPALYSNKLLVMKKIDGRVYITRESIENFIAMHEYGNGRWHIRKNSLPENKIKNEIEQRRQLSKMEQTVLRLYKNGNSVPDIAKKINRTSKTVRNYLRCIGVYDKNFIKEQYGNLHLLQNKVMPGVCSYSKDATRTKMLETLVEYFADNRKVQYLGLEGPHFCSYIQIAQLLGKQLEQSKSLVAEMGLRKYNIMDSIVKNHDAIEGGEIFKGLNVREGELSEVLENSRNEGFKFNFLNLDYEGHISATKIYALRTLFGSQMLQDEAIFFITLNDSPYLKKRLKGKRTLGAEFINGFGTDDQQAIVEKELKKLCTHNQYKLERLGVERYKDRDSQMLTMAYHIRRGQQ